jgi:hypothetical protein
LSGFGNGSSEGVELERRIAKRFPAKQCTVDCSAVTLWAFLKKPATKRYPLVNFSETGLQFLTPAALPRGAELNMHILVPGLPGPLEARGKVTWCRRIEGKPFHRTGVQFTKISKGQVQALGKVGENLLPPDLSKYMKKAN